MAEQRFIIQGPTEDGVEGPQYSVTKATFDDQYKAEGFTIIGPDGDVTVAEPKRPKASDIARVHRTAADAIEAAES